MKRQLLAILTIGLLTSAVWAQLPTVAPTNEVKTDFSKIFKSDKEKISYAVGMYAASIKSRLKSQDIDFDVDTLIKGFSDSVGAGPTLITEDQKKEILGDLDKAIRSKMEQKRKQQAEENRLLGEKNKTEGPAFLAKNKSQPGVVTLPSGLQYKVITDGTGPIPTTNDEVSVNYRGTLIDGTEFDNSAKRGRPFTTKVQGGIIKGWTEALQLMKTGSKWQIFIPSELAYGPNPPGPTIPPNAVLIFEMELVSTHPAPAPAPMAAHNAPPGAPLTSDIIKVPSAEEIKKGAKIETIKAEDLEKEQAKTNQ
jgi:FKBP-type peptidyl-prolyl cis-trans isomerase FklB